MSTSSMMFTKPQVVKLTGIPASTLTYWEKTGVFGASHVDERRNLAYRRLYTFTDLVGLRTLRRLRGDFKINLDQLRNVGRYLNEHRDAPWASIKFGVQECTVVFLDPVSSEYVSGNPLGQGVMMIDLENEARHAEVDVRQLFKRGAKDIGQLTRHRNVMSNAWVVAGTRIPTSAIWSFHEDGFALDHILNAYPDLTPIDVESAIRHEAEMRGLVSA